MGTDLRLLYRGKEIVDLGRAHQFENSDRDIDIAEAYDYAGDDYIRLLVQKIMAYASHNTSVEELPEALAEIRMALDEVMEECFRKGKCALLSTILEEEGMTWKKHF